MMKTKEIEKIIPPIETVEINLIVISGSKGLGDEVGIAWPIAG
ncbi:hypothetical protein SDC9_85816 [bioreactor metagenome]|uniref:Uncharacterized protein n=1 Tax=bioreactor metagenome TaxID=1076179 RepID=A0A644ZKH8_9ZZZZ